MRSTFTRRPGARWNLVPEPPPATEPFLGSSIAVQELLAQADRLARADLPILLSGESGTGKEVLARRIHALGPRAAGPFVAENCAAIPEGLAENEFFGHARGAFTGADDDHDGAFVQAQGGTLLLDEIGDMPLGLQAKLLRVLESERVRPIGASREIEVDVRVLCATNADLEQLVREGRFRQDLYYRLCGVALRLPPLRARLEDVELLARHFLAQLNREHGTRKELSRRLADQLSMRLWPGNVRELRHRIAALYHLCEGDLLDAAELELELVGPERTESLVNAVAPLAEIERDAILLALRESGGDASEAARVLGISRSGIYDKIRRYGLSRGPLRHLPGHRPAGRPARRQAVVAC